MSAAISFAAGLMRCTAMRRKITPSTCRAVAGNSVIYAIADNRGQVVPESEIRKIVISTGDQTDTVSISRNSPLPVEVISAAGAIHWVDPGRPKPLMASPTHATIPAAEAASAARTAPGHQADPAVQPAAPVPRAARAVTATSSKPSGSSSSSSTGTSSGSSGSGASTVPPVNSTQVSVASFGAVGDGVTDDSAAIKRQLTVRLRVPP